MQAVAKKPRGFVKVCGFAIGTHPKEGLRRDAKFERPVVVELRSLRPSIDLEPWPGACEQIAHAGVQRQTVERNDPVDFETAVRGTLARVLLEVDEIFSDGPVD